MCHEGIPIFQADMPGHGTYSVYLADWPALIAAGLKTITSATLYGEVTEDQFYHLAPYQLEADNLEDVFVILNLHHPDNCPYRSLCVGDLVVDPGGRTWVCKGVGWELVEKSPFRAN